LLERHAFLRIFGKKAHEIGPKVLKSRIIEIAYPLFYKRLIGIFVKSLRISYIVFFLTNYQKYYSIAFDIPMMNRIVDCPVSFVVYRYFVKGQAKEKVRVTPFSNGG
jgi:hypothetical protein